MHHSIQLTTVEAAPTAVVRERVEPHGLSKFVPTACGEVWSFIREAGLPRPGRHVALYLADHQVEVGAEVSEPFVGNDRVIARRSPQEKWSRRLTSAPMRALAKHTTRCGDGARKTGTWLPGFVGKSTGTGRKAGMPIPHRSSRRSSICSKTLPPEHGGRMGLIAPGGSGASSWRGL